LLPKSSALTTLSTRPRAPAFQSLASVIVNAHNRRVKYWEIIADNVSKAGWSWGCASTINSNGQTIWIADAHRGDGKPFVAALEIDRSNRFHISNNAWMLNSSPNSALARSHKQ
jgi:hypothetical protein